MGFAEDMSKLADKAGKEDTKSLREEKRALYYIDKIKMAIESEAKAGRKELEGALNNCDRGEYIETLFTKMFLPVPHKHQDSTVVEYDINDSKVMDVIRAREKCSAFQTNISWQEREATRQYYQAVVDSHEKQLDVKHLAELIKTGLEEEGFKVKIDIERVEYFKDYTYTECKNGKEKKRGLYLPPILCYAFKFFISWYADEADELAYKNAETLQNEEFEKYYRSTLPKRSPYSKYYSIAASLILLGLIIFTGWNLFIKIVLGIIIFIILISIGGPAEDLEAKEKLRAGWEREHPLSDYLS